MHLNGSLGLLMIGLGAFPTLIIGIEIGQNYIDPNSYRSDPFDMPWEVFCFFCLGFGFVASGVALIFKIKWARFVSSIFILTGAIWWCYIIFEEFRFRGSRYWIEVGIFIFICALLFYGLLYLGNEKVRQDFGEIEKGDWDDKILDA